MSTGGSLLDNTVLAKFIVSLGSLNNYGSTVLQTKQAIDLMSDWPLNQSSADVIIFNVDGIIAVNQQFNTELDEQPN